jgi:hypothetical protein
MSDEKGLPQRKPGENGPVVGGERMPVPHAEPRKKEKGK